MVTGDTTLGVCEDVGGEYVKGEIVGCATSLLTVPCITDDVGRCDTEACMDEAS